MCKAGDIALLLTDSPAVPIRVDDSNYGDFARIKNVGHKKAALRERLSCNDESL